jgi:hypothetical protein
MRVSLRLWLSAAALLFSVATSASAQVTSWNLILYQGSTVISAISVAASQVLCSQPPPPATVAVNPSTWVWDDAYNQGAVCTYVDPRLKSLVDGLYEAALQAVTAEGTSRESYHALFSIVAGSAPPPPTDPPPAPSGCVYAGTTYPVSDQLYTFSAKRQTQESVTTSLTAGGWTILSPWRQVRGNNYLIDAVCVVK